MSAAPFEPKGPKGISKPRRLSFLVSSQGPSHTGSESKTMKYVGVNFYFSQILGLPASWLKQYRIVVRSGDLRSTTSWKVSGQPEFRVDETTEGMDLFMSSELIFTLERRNLLSKPLLVGNTKTYLVSELVSKQEVRHPDPFTLELESKGEYPLSFIELNIRLFPARAEHPDLPDGESRARVVYEVYPDAVSDALTALQEFGFVLSDPSKQISYRTLSEMVDHMGKYILDHPRKELSYDCEDNAWLFLRETTKCLKKYQASSGKANPSSGQLTYLANRILRGFWLLLQLHIPSILDYDNRHKNFIKQELLQIGNSFTRKPNPPATKLVPISTQYPLLLRLKGVDMQLPSLQAPGIEPLFYNTPFKEIVRWMVDHEPEHQVFWLHGKFESGTARSQVVAALLETSKMTGFPVAYYSFPQSATESKPNQQSQSMLGSMIYQLSLCNQDLAGAFNTAIAESSEAFVSLDFYSRFQIILHTLLSLSISEQAASFPVLLIIDNIDPSNAGLPSLEYDQLLQILYTASVATRAVTPASSPVPGSPFGPDEWPTSFPAAHYNSLPLPSFLRIVVLSHSLGNNPSLIEKFAFIRADGHRISGMRFPRRLYNPTVNSSHKGKARERVPLDRAPLIPIAEVNSQAGGI